MQLTLKVDTSQLNSKLKEYMNYSRRSLSEAVNQHAYYIARNAVNSTRAATKEEIKRDLEAASNKYPSVPLAAILVNKKRREDGKPGLSGTKMTTEIERFIRKAQASRNFLRAGWIPAVKKLEGMVKQRGGPKMVSGVKIKGVAKGGAKPAISSSYLNRFVCKIWNSVFGGKKANPRVTRYLEEGAQIAINLEIASMQKYIEKKQAEAAHRSNLHVGHH